MINPLSLRGEGRSPLNARGYWNADLRVAKGIGMDGSCLFLAEWFVVADWVVGSAIKCTATLPMSFKSLDAR